MSIERENLKLNSELRLMARQQLQGKWGMSILVCFLCSLILGGVGAIPFAGLVASLVIAGPFTLGQTIYFVRLKRGDKPPLEVMFDGFSKFKTSFLLYLLYSIFVLLWSLLLIIPGIIAALSYSMSFYILYDNPQMTSMEALRASKEMMRGYKGKLFLLYLSFIGWALLCVLTLGIGYLWLAPYIQTATANFYDNLKNSRG